MNDFKITLNKRQELYVSRLLPKGFSFELYKVRKNINDYPYKQFDKKYKKTESIILSKRESIIESIEPSEQSFREKSQPPKQNEPLNKIQQDCLAVLKTLKRHQSSHPFRFPVDPKALQIPDYFDIILEPIDLKTIEQNIRRDMYVHFAQFQRDIYKMIMNSYKYNQRISLTYTKTIQFEEFFTQTVKDFSSKGNYSVEASNEVKQEMVDEYKFGDQVKKQPLPTNNLKQTPPLVNPFKQQSKTKVGKIFREIEIAERPRHSKKQLPKRIEPTLVPKIQQRHQPTVKIQENQSPEVDNTMLFSQQVEAHTAKQQSELIKDQVRSYMQNQTQQHREMNFSQGGNEALLGQHVKKHEEQRRITRQITNLLKRLGQYPLTKQKRTKILSKFNNLQQNMTQSDKKKLYEKIFKLDENDIEYVIQILLRGKSQLARQDEFQIDLDRAETKVLREIQNFVMLRDGTYVGIENGTGGGLGGGGNGGIGGLANQSANQASKPKKVRKQQKKNLKKKLSRKDGDDDSFNINPPPPKMKKSQKPQRRRDDDDNEQYNPQPLSGQEKSQSSYHPQLIHSQPTHTFTRGTSNGHVNSAHVGQQKQGKTVSLRHHQQSSSHQISHYHHHQNGHHQPHFPQAHSITIQDPDKFLDLDQYIVPSNHQQNYLHQNDQSVCVSSRSANRNRISQHLLPLDYIEDHPFQFKHSVSKEYPEPKFQEYSENQDENDGDQFFGDQ